MNETQLRKMSPPRATRISTATAAITHSRHGAGDVDSVLNEGIYSERTEEQGGSCGSPMTKCQVDTTLSLPGPLRPANILRVPKTNVVSCPQNIFENRFVGCHTRGRQAISPRKKMEMEMGFGRTQTWRVPLSDVGG